jgi:hypothetical protein
MERVIRPIGKVGTALRRHGYRQQAAIVVDGQPLEHVAIYSKQVADKIKFEGHFIDPNGELHKTTEYIDMKRAAASIVKLREEVLAAKATKPAAKSDAKTQRANRRQRRQEPAPVQADEGSRLIDCKGCGLLHRDDTLCPW